jgi:hypothetical protein
MPEAPALIPVSASYKWPRKVVRYKITCPFQRLIIVEHEGPIDWSGHRIESAEALYEFIKEVMLPGLHRWMDSDDENHVGNGSWTAWKVNMIFFADDVVPQPA